jgi:hypothetical protein
VSSTVILKAAGLITSPNQLDLPDGALSEANNVIIKRDNVIEPRRGFKLYGDEFPNGQDRAKQLMIYRNRIIRHYNEILQYDSDDEGSFVDFNGSYTEPEEGIRIRSVEANGNFYFTTSDGIKKISSPSADKLDSATIDNSGGIKAVDLSARVPYEANIQTGFLTQDGTVAYRVVWARRDANNNLILGAPSQRALVYNPLITLLNRDFYRILLALDNINNGGTSSAQITDSDYIESLKLPVNATAVELYNNLVALTAKIDRDIEYAGNGKVIELSGGTGNVEVDNNIATITKVSGANFDDYLQAGSEIEISGMPITDPRAVLNGIHTISTLDNDSISFVTDSLTDFVDNSGSTDLITSAEYSTITKPSFPIVPTPNNQLLTIQEYIDTIINRLQNEPPIGNLTGIVIEAADQTEFIQALDITTSASAILEVTIPEEITTDYFLQVYRSSVAQATGPSVIEDILPSDELQLVFEQYVTDDDLNLGLNPFRIIQLEDTTPDQFRGANLYTNASTGEGILQSNDVPPFAKDVNRFRNVVFFANTRTRHRTTISLLGVQRMLDAALTTVPSITITNGIDSQTYNFVVGQKELTELTCIEDDTDGSNAGVTLNGKFFDMNSVDNDTLYRFHYRVFGEVDATPVDDGRQLVSIDIAAESTAEQVASKTSDVISTISTDFISQVKTSPNDDTIEIENLSEGISDGIDVGTSGFTPFIINDGVGEDSSSNQILLSNITSPAQAVDATARSIVKVINQDPNGIVYAYYLSGTTDVPGEILFEARSIGEGQFAIIGNDSETGLSFNPDISPQYNIIDIQPASNPTNASEITTDVPHGYLDGENVYITLTDTFPIINGFKTIEVVDVDKFKIRDTDIITITDFNGTVSSDVFSQLSENEVKQNRIYYSKFQQPEAVPIVNYFDVGAEDKPIYRIYPLRDSLFVFKADGVFRVSGETSPFNVQLFDSSTTLIADDTVSVSDNVLYCWSEQGISVISESNASLISRNIDNEILQIGSANFKNFRTATWGIGYESDNSYIVYTTAKEEDEVATVGYRYSTLTDTWTKITKTTTCGIVNTADDKLYLGAGDVAQLEVERKDFARTDYADREYDLIIGNGTYENSKLFLNSVTIPNPVEVGDVIAQTQTLTVFQYNMLLQQLDDDTTLALNLKNGDPDGYISLEAKAGDNMRGKMIQLASRLDSDPSPSDDDFLETIQNQSLLIDTIEAGSIVKITTTTDHGLFTGRYVNIALTDSNPVIDGTYQVIVIDDDTFTIDKEVFGSGSTGTVITDSDSFDDMKVSYNKIIQKLNEDSGVSFNNYPSINDTTVQEAIVINVDFVTKQLTLNQNLDFISGTVRLYKSIDSSFRYAPNTMGDPLGHKHLREATIMFENKAFTSATMDFSTDLLPSLKRVPMNGDGNGIFGHESFGEGFFGGASHSAPFRTYIPREAQRCTFIKIGFAHKTAREKYSIFAVTVTGEIGLSSRAYR